MGGSLFSIIIEESTELLIAFYDIEQKSCYNVFLSLMTIKTATILFI